MKKILIMLALMIALPASANTGVISTSNQSGYSNPKPLNKDTSQISPKPLPQPDEPQDESQAPRVGAGGGTIHLSNLFGLNSYFSRTGLRIWDNQVIIQTTKTSNAYIILSQGQNTVRIDSITAGTVHYIKLPKLSGEWQLQGFAVKGFEVVKTQIVSLNFQNGEAVDNNYK